MLHQEANGEMSAKGENMICTSCSREVANTNKYCPECGAEFNSLVVGLQPSPRVAPPNYNQPQISSIKAAVRHDGLAIAGMIVGIIAVLMFWWPVSLLIGIVGIVLSCIAMKRIKSSPFEVAGYGMAVAGLVTGICGSVMAVIMMMFYFG